LRRHCETLLHYLKVIVVERHIREVKHSGGVRHRGLLISRNGIPHLNLRGRNYSAAGIKDRTVDRAAGDRLCSR
jgi:hypothetical protein